MMKFALGTTLLFGLLAACGGDDKPTVKLPDGSVEMTCSPTDQTGCPTGQKCTWLIDAVTANNVVGHTGCAPDGTVAAGGDCEFGAPGETGFDNCVKGTVCSDFRQDGMEPHKVCKSICDRQDGTPGCGSDQYCFNYASLFSTGDTTPAAGGICEQACDPMTDNDFDGSGTASMKTGGKCDNDPRIGCYGSISSGSGTVETQFACVRDRHYNLLQPVGLRHRTPCTVDNGCQDPGPKTYTNSCNQGYQPLLRESTMVSTTVCTALCKPDNCYMGACGTPPGDENHVGIIPNRCDNNDRVGMFFQEQGSAAAHLNGEHCHFLWRAEAGSNGFVPSQFSDTVGYCVDHTQYQYDKDGDGTAETNLPPCASLPMGFGSGSQQSDPNYWGAADLGCVDTMKAGIQTATGKAMLERALAKQRAVDLPRPLYGAENAF